MRIAFAGLSPLCERIVRDAIERRPGIELVKPWTELPSLSCRNGETPEMLVVELKESALPPALRVLLSTAPELRIIALSPDAHRATLFRVHEQRTVLFDGLAEDLCSLIDPQ